MIKLDSIDLKILKTLQEDGRIANIDLSNKINLSPAPTLERVKKLERAGIIKGYRAELDTYQLGFGTETFMLVSLAFNQQNAIDNFTQGIGKISEVVECYQVTGASDFILRILVKDINAYEVLVREKLSLIKEITNMQTMVIMSIIKKTRVFIDDKK
ncbi:MAG: Lrp/AsnC family transcriptional regulator [Bacteroidetes bacterium]|nr:Lrp/AsnC family transcriptional regulator [Bacteroidota bacterium]